MTTPLKDLRPAGFLGLAALSAALATPNPAALAQDGKLPPVEPGAKRVEIEPANWFKAIITPMGVNPEVSQQLEAVLGKHGTLKGENWGRASAKERALVLGEIGRALGIPNDPKVIMGYADPGRRVADYGIYVSDGSHVISFAFPPLQFSSIRKEQVPDAVREAVTVESQLKTNITGLFQHPAELLKLADAAGKLDRANEGLATEMQQKVLLGLLPGVKTAVRARSDDTKVELALVTGDHDLLSATVPHRVFTAKARDGITTADITWDFKRGEAEKILTSPTAAGYAAVGLPRGSTMSVYAPPGWNNTQLGRFGVVVNPITRRVDVYNRAKDATQSDSLRPSDALVVIVHPDNTITLRAYSSNGDTRDVVTRQGLQ